MFLEVLTAWSDELDGSKLVSAHQISTQASGCSSGGIDIPALLETRDDGTNQSTLHDG